MIVALKPGISKDKSEQLIKWLSNLGLSVNVVEAAIRQSWDWLEIPAKWTWNWLKVLKS